MAELIQALGNAGLGTHAMRVDLIELLAKRSITHPTRLERISICHNRMEMIVSGYPWWTETPENAPPSQITLVFEELSLGSLAVCLNGPFSDDLEDFSIQPLSGVVWAQPANEEIYCKGPIPDPITLYTRLEAALNAAEAFIRPWDLLNQGSALADFLTLASR